MSDPILNPVQGLSGSSDVFARATKAKRLTDIELGTVEHKYASYDHQVKETRSESEADFARRKEKFGLSSIDGLISDLFKRFLGEYLLLFVGGECIAHEEQSDESLMLWGIATNGTVTVSALRRFALYVSRVA